MTNQSHQPVADDLCFLGDLDRGLDLETDLDRPAYREPTPDRRERQRSRQHRPLLELFPPDRPESVAPPLSAGPPAAFTVVRPTYETFYGLNEKPFSLAADPRFLYHSAGHDRATREILAAIERRDGTVIVTGGPGSGKTMLCRSVIERLDSRTFTSLIVESFVSIEDLLRTVLIDFGVISHVDLAGRPSAPSRHELTIVLKEFLLSLAPLEAFAVIFVDDAHNLSAEMIDQVRGLSGLAPDKPLLQVVLSGKAEMLSRMERPGGHRLEQGVTVCELAPLSEEEIAAYVRHRLAVAGGGAPSRVEFDGSAFTLIDAISRGVPQVINRIGDRALTLGYEQGVNRIDATVIRTAAHDLDLLRLEDSAPARKLGVGSTVLTALMMVALMLTGAGAATFVFSARVQRVVTAWQAMPLLPPPPSPQVVEPAGHVPLPDAGVREGAVTPPLTSPR